MSAIYERLSDPDGLAVCEHEPYEQTSQWWLNRLFVPAPHRGRGIGSRLLSRLAAEADEAGKEIYLLPSPYDYPAEQRREIKDRLLAFYERHGFKQLDSGFMMRRPS